MIGPLLLIALVTGVLAQLMLRIGRRYLLDHPNQRSSHRVATPRGGGIAILGGMTLGVLWSGDAHLRWAFLWIVLVAALSFADDLRPLSARLRFAGHLIISIGVILTLGAFTSIGLPGLFQITNQALLVALTILWIVGLINAYNFMDGIDGLASGQGVVAGALWWGIGLALGASALSWGGASVTIPALVFLAWNWQPAKIFLGDVGSAALGLTFALLPLLAASATSVGDWAPLIGLLSIWPFLFDTIFTLIRRARRGERLSVGHRSHLYQRLVITGWSHARVTSVYLGFASLNALAGLLCWQLESLWPLVAMPLTGGALLWRVTSLEAR